MNTHFALSVAWICKILFLFLSVLSFAVHPTPGAVTEAWVQRFTSAGMGSNDKAVEVVRDAAGDIIVAGSSDNSFTGFDFLTIKYSGANESVTPSWNPALGIVENGMAPDTITVAIPMGNTSAMYARLRVTISP